MEQWMAYCKGCGKLIVWTKMQSRKSMPCDPEVIRFVPGEGSEMFVTPDGLLLQGKRDPQSNIIGYISHFATCPKANGFRKG